MCEDEYNKYTVSLSDIEKFNENLSLIDSDILTEKTKLNNLENDVRERYPSSTELTISKIAYKESEVIVKNINDNVSLYNNWIDKLKLLKEISKGYYNSYNECLANKETEIKNNVKEYVDSWNNAYNGWDYLKAIGFYQKAKEISTNQTIKDNLAKAYYQYANWLSYKWKDDDAIKYYNLALNEGYWNKYNIYMWLGWIYYTKTTDNWLNSKNLETALSFYNKALSFTSDYDEIDRANLFINQIKDIKNNLDKKAKETENEKNQKLIQTQANIILERLDNLTNKYSSNKRKNLYDLCITKLTKYSNSLKDKDKKAIIDAVINWIKQKNNDNIN